LSQRAVAVVGILMAAVAAQAVYWQEQRRLILGQRMRLLLALVVRQGRHLESPGQMALRLLLLE
jgi:hypothetical protein